VEVVWVPTATWAGVQTRLLAGKWHVLHFVGHGDYDTRTDEGLLALVGEDGRADLIEASRLADLLGEAQPAPRLVMLNSCSSGQTGAQDLFSGTAATLVRSGISAVAAMQFAVSDTAAIAFARGFYTAIAHGRSVDEAARSGRISILGAPHSLEWLTPVLYVRGRATQLFTMTGPPESSRQTPAAPPAVPESPSLAATPPPPAATKPPASIRTYDTARRTWAGLRAMYDEARATGASKPAPERGRRHGQAAASGTGWVRTSERFRDPTTGKIMRVWIDPKDQSRHYVPEDDS
jgi:hypothetical protein